MSDPVGGSCPACDLEDARELAKRWAAWRAVMAGQVRRYEDIDAAEKLPERERRRLFAWVRERAQDIRARDPHGAYDRRDVAAAFEAELSAPMPTGEMFGFENAWQLIEAAGWPS